MPFPNIGAPELIVILIIALIVLGPGKLPDVASSLGKSLREFRRAASDVSDATKIDVPAASSTVSAGAAVTPESPVVPAANTLSSSSEPNTLTAPAGPAADPDRS
ncbi:MAG: twin-arginine translocase TatA/TatE family subunit [Candidatus Limnocylindrales bacterium]